MSIQLFCSWCDKGFLVDPYRVKTAKFCSRNCLAKGRTKTSKGVSRHKGDKHPMWKGGRTINSQGYVLVYSPNHPNKTASNKVREHRLVVESIIGRYLEKNEDVHHIDGDKLNNSIDNLVALTKSEHTKLHHRQRKAKVVNT